MMNLFYRNLKYFNIIYINIKLKIYNMKIKIEKYSSSLINIITILIYTTIIKVTIRPIKTQVLTISNPDLTLDSKTNITMDTFNPTKFDNRCLLTLKEPKKVTKNLTNIKIIKF